MSLLKQIKKNKEGWRKVVDIKLGEEIAAPKLEGLLAQEGEEEARHHGNLAYPKDEHPFNQFCSHFTYFFGQPSFKFLLNKNNDILLEPVIRFMKTTLNLSDDVHQSISALISEAFAKNFGNRYNSHVPYLSAGLISVNSITAPQIHVKENALRKEGRGEGDLLWDKVVSKLSVSGALAASGTIKGGISAPDIAENITASIDKEAPRDESQRPLALAGRVPVKVSLENGPIKIGDYLTTSSKPGYAMKATEPGPVIGIALENFNREKAKEATLTLPLSLEGEGKGEGEGKILVFLANGEGNLAANLLKAQDEIKILRESLEELKLEFSKLKHQVTSASGASEGGK